MPKRFMACNQKILRYNNEGTPKVYLQLWQRSHWPGSSVSEECSKSKHLNGGLPVLSAPITIFKSKLPKGLGM